MAKKQPDDEGPELTGDEPITAKTVLVAALRGTDLPPVEGTLREWQATLPQDLELARRVAELVYAASIGDVSAAKHWAHQAEDAFLRASVHGKPHTHT